PRPNLGFVLLEVTAIDLADDLALDPLLAGGADVSDDGELSPRCHRYRIDDQALDPQVLRFLHADVHEDAADTVRHLEVAYVRTVPAGAGAVGEDVEIARRRFRCAIALLLQLGEQPVGSVEQHRDGGVCRLDLEVVDVLAEEAGAFAELAPGLGAVED